MKKQFFLFMMALLPMAASADDSGTCGYWGNEGSVTWKWVESTHTITISGKGKMRDYCSPNYEDPFFSPTPWDNYIESIQTLVIESGVTSVAGFQLCTNLSSVTLPNTITLIDNYAFYSCAISSISLPPNLETIGFGAFFMCQKLNSITIPSNVNNIGPYAFSGCNSLSSIQVESGNSVYDSRNNCNAIIEQNSGNVTLIAGCKNTVIPNGVIRIGPLAFHNLSSLTTLVIPQSVEEISDKWISNCENLSAIYCYAAQPPFFYSSGYPGFPVQSMENVILYVPSSLLNDYSGGVYKAILPIESSGDPKCATPTIRVNNGILNFECATEGAVFHYKVDSDRGFGGETYKYDRDNDGGINGVILPTITISVYASKEGYSFSDTATKVVKLSDVGGKRGDLNGDGEVNVTDHVELSNIILNPQENE